jgi:hypothetical protein
MTKKTQSNPTMASVLKDFKSNIFADLNCHAIGKIESFNILKQTASASIVHKRVSELDVEEFGEIEPMDYPKLVDCPVLIMGGGDGSIRFPVKNGDNCVILFNDRDIDGWYSGGGDNLLASNRKHSFSDGIIIVGLHSLKNPITNYSEDRTELVHDKTMISMKDRIRIKNDFANLFTILNLLMDSITPTTGITPELKEAVKLQLALLMET